jgi:hypothetical protein
MASVSTRPASMHGPQGDSYGGEEGIVGDVRERRAGPRTGIAGSNLLGQLVLRCVGFHELLRGAPVQKFDTPLTLAGERGRCATSLLPRRTQPMRG